MYRSKAVKIVEEVYDSGRYSPVLMKYSKVEPGVLLVEPAEDRARLEFLQQRLSKRQGYAVLIVIYFYFGDLVNLNRFCTFK